MAYPTLEVPKGNIVRSQCVFRALGAFVDPTSVTCKTKQGAAAAVSATVVKDATGRYHADLDTSSFSAGPVTITWKATGSAVALVEREILVTEPVIP